MNKMDRDSQDHMQLLADLQDKDKQIDELHQRIKILVSIFSSVISCKYTDKYQYM